MEPVMINSRFETFSKHVISALFKILLDAFNYMFKNNSNKSNNIVVAIKEINLSEVFKKCIKI